MWELAALNFGIQWSGWAIATILKTERFYDLFGSLTYILLTSKSYWDISRPQNIQKIQTACVLGWAARLGSFLFYRIIKDGKDRRFDEIKQSPLRFFSAWTLQGVWVIVTLYPTLMLLSKRLTFTTIPLRAKIGFAMWIAGFIMESVADQQKMTFKNNLENKEKFISSGLWNISRHPNYFGEMLIWAGLWLSSSCSFTTPIEYFSILCPLFDILLITKLSGIPMLEARANKKWANLPEYQEYVKKTAVLVPWIW